MSEEEEDRRTDIREPKKLLFRAVGGKSLICTHMPALSVLGAAAAAAATALEIIDPEAVTTPWSPAAAV